MSRHSPEDVGAWPEHQRTDVIFEDDSDADRFWNEHPTDAYLRVLAELQRKRREIDAAINAIRQMLAENALDSKLPESIALDGELTLTDAIESILKQLRRPARNSEIKSALIENGYQLSGNPDVSIHQALHRLIARDAAIKVGRGVWVHREFS